MSVDTVEVECPVCDQKIPANALRCPNCGADFSMSGVDELEKVAHEINDPASADNPSVQRSTRTGQAAGTSPSQKVTGERPPPETTGPAERKDGLLGRLFKKKK